MRTRVIETDPRAVKLLDRNARFMRHETFRRLVENVRADGALTQIPFAVPSGDPEAPWLVVSGNHRVRAAVEAGLATIDLQVTEDPIEPDRLTAIQLSHNAIVGEDDPATLKQLYESIGSIEWKEFAGLDDRTLDLLAKVSIEPGAAAPLDWTSVTFVFLPDEADRLRAALAEALAAAKGAPVAARFADYDRFQEALDAVRGAHDVMNAATALLLVLDLFDRHVGELAAGFLDDAGEPRHRKPVPAAAALGAATVPTATAALLRRVLARTSEEGPFAPLDAACREFLAAPTP
jgi:hypothetical protein